MLDRARLALGTPPVSGKKIPELALLPGVDKMVTYTPSDAMDFEIRNPLPDNVTKYASFVGFHGIKLPMKVISANSAFNTAEQNLEIRSVNEKTPPYGILNEAFKGSLTIRTIGWNREPLSGS